jgi:hypothetical protein
MPYDELEKLVDELESFFRSGNSVPIERATVKGELVVPIIKEVRELIARIKSLEH